MAIKRVMKNFSEEDEEKLRAFVFTNPHGNDSFIYPQPLVAGEELSPLMSAYSRTHVPMQERVLQFLDQEKTEQTKDMLPLIDPLMKIFRDSDGSLKVSKRTGDFNKEWVLAHGHSSIKEETPLFGHVENISDIAGKRITGHPLIKPQVKSTRYLSYGKVLDLSLGDEDILSMPENHIYLEHIAKSNALYLDATEQLTDGVYNHKYTRKIQEFLRGEQRINEEIQKRIARKKMLDEGFIPNDSFLKDERDKILAGLEDEQIKKEIGKFVLDYSRNHLLAVTNTSMGFSVDARTLEEIISDLISSPRIEDRNRGYSIWKEAKKIAPVLLGDKSHIKVDDWKIKNEIEFRNYIEKKFSNLIFDNSEEDMVRTITPKDIGMYSDKFNAALISFQYLGAPLEDIFDYLKKDSDVNEILSKSHEYRGNRDIIHSGISHGGLMMEICMPYHGYRDIFRHRRGSRTTQLLTTRIGFEVPEIFKTFRIDKVYMNQMRKSCEIYEKVRKVNRHVAEKLVPFGAKCRSLHSWQPNQVAYIGNLRADITKGNLTYVNMAREMTEQVSKIMPQTSKYFRIDNKTYPPELWKRGYSWYDQNVRGKNAD